MDPISQDLMRRLPEKDLETWALIELRQAEKRRKLLAAARGRGSNWYGWFLTLVLAIVMGANFHLLTSDSHWKFLGFVCMLIVAQQVHLQRLHRQVDALAELMEEKPKPDTWIPPTESASPAS